jgi:membrane-bound inhibitor of C-type lysozyme
MRNKIIIGVALIITIIGLFFWLRPHTAVAPAVTDVTKLTAISTAQYICNNKKTIDAAFYDGAATTTTLATDTPPIPTGTVDLNLSDSRNLTLTETISADGARYSDGDPQKTGSESFIFWSKGNGALVTDKGDEKSYWGCVTSAPFTAALPNVYHDGQNGYTIRYSADWNIDSAYTYRLRGPDEAAPTGVKFRIPVTMATGTNLSSFDTGISVEIDSTSKDSGTCSASDFAGQAITATTTTLLLARVTPVLATSTKSASSPSRTRAPVPPYATSSTPPASPTTPKAPSKTSTKPLS